METPDTASDWPRYPDLAGRVALVTGGSKALGAAACHALAANGVAVAVGGRDQAGLDSVVTQITAAGGRAVAVPGDVTDQATMAAIRRRVQDELGPVQILLPFAGGQGLPTPTTELGLERWRAVIDSDLTSVYLTIATFLPAMIERGGGAIVTMASTAGRLPGQANAAYAAAKAGVVMLTRHLAREVAGHGIRVNCLAPSAVLNERMEAAMTGAQRDGLAAMFPLGRIGRPADIGHAVLYLASDAASWITGVTLDITGGQVMV